VSQASAYPAVKRTCGAVAIRQYAPAKRRSPRTTQMDGRVVAPPCSSLWMRPQLANAGWQLMKELRDLAFANTVRDDRERNAGNVFCIP